MSNVSVDENDVSSNDVKDNGEYVLEMIGISKSFPGVKALDNVDFRVRPGTVHALMGENGAGKSTLMKCLFGMYIEDSGEIRISGKPVNFKSARKALDAGVSMVHQELNQVLKMSIMDNIWLGRYPSNFIKVNQKKMYHDTKKIFEELNIDIDPRMRIGNLSVSQRQMAEIAKAVSYNAKILVFDEPTSSLTETEVKHLFNIITYLKSKGCGIIYISHKMEEILAISDEVTVMRDGKWVATNAAADLDMDKMIKLMVGRDLTDRFPPKDNVPGEVAFEVKNLTGTYQPNVIDVNFSVRRGEIFGIAGLVGSKRTELLENIFGVAHHEKGEFILNNKPLVNKSPRHSILNKFAFLTEERRSTGIFPGLSVEFNSIIANLDSYAKFGVVDNKKTAKDTAWVINSMRVKTPHQKTHIRSLSGGNQQKVIIGRWLLTDADVYLLDEPTRGIDVGAKFEIYQLIIDLAKKGKIVLVVSSEMSELLGITDRIMVMSNGRVAGIEDTKNLNQEEILRLAAKFI